MYFEMQLNLRNTFLPPPTSLSLIANSCLFHHAYTTVNDFERGRDGFTKKIAVLLDFVQMRGGRALPKFFVQKWYKLSKGAGSFHIHRKTMKELGSLAVLGIREQPNLAQNLVTHRH